MAIFKQKEMIRELSNDEITAIVAVLKEWPNRMGCVLIPDTKGKNGYKPVDWGWKGKIPGNFNYMQLHVLLLDQKDALLCPVTTVGILRNARNFSDHMKAYRAIRSMYAKIRNISEHEAQIEYNALLKTDAKKLAEIFEQGRGC